MEGSSQMRPGGVDPNSSSNRAQKHDDEKRRIIESCFNKKDEEGNSIESYITHLRIIEDGAFPSGPPPPNSPQETKKARLIIVAVRKSGRVRLHKARENNNGTFSIGKTWPIDDLTAVRSYSRPVLGTAEEQQQMGWAGGVGFSVTLGKTYYWQANAPKEKQFFIASIVKIFHKYTGGRHPQLTGFDDRELEQLLGPRPMGQTPPPPTSPMSNPPYPPQQQQNRPPRRDPSREPVLRQQPSRDPMQRPSLGYQNMPPSYSSGGSRPPPSREGRAISPASGLDTDASPNTQPNLRQLGTSNPSQESFGTDASSLPPRSRGMNGNPNSSGRFSERSMTPTSQRTMTPDGGQLSRKETFDEVPPVPAPLAMPPERRRPPIPPGGDSTQRAPNSSDSFVPAPLVSPGMRRDDMRPSTRGSEKSLAPSGDGSVGSNVPIDSFSEPSRPKGKDELVNLTAIDKPVNVVSTESENPTIDKTNDFTVNEQPDKVQEVTSPILSGEEEESRPGLGPMIKKRNNAANNFLKAARAAKTINAFKPRAGGAAERLREAQSKAADGPDGITGVVPAPLLRGMSDDNLKTAPKPASLESTTDMTLKQSIPEVKVTVPESTGTNVDQTTKPVQEPTTDKPKVRDTRRQKPPAETMERELRAIGVDPAIIGDKGMDLITAWDDFGFVGEKMRTVNIDQMQEQVQRELDRIQTGSDFLKFIDEQDERVTAVHKGLEATIEACDELEALLTLYLVELDTLTPDITYIEAQSQGLQVQAANQKLLQAELKSLLDTISISSEQLACLREASLESTRGLEQVETSLVLLYKAMVTIEPTLGVSAPRTSEDASLSSGKPGGYGSSEIGSMRVLQEKKDVYRNESAMFLRRLKTFLQVKFAAAVDETRKALEAEKSNNLARTAGKAKLDPRNHDLARQLLWRYSPLMLFSREVDRSEWEDLLKNYELACKSLYQDEFRDAIFSWKRIARKPSGDEIEVLFTAQAEKHTEGIATTARKLTVKRSQTLAKSLRSPGGESGRNADKGSDGRIHPYEAFSGALDEMVPIITMEQNFIVEFFHMTSLEQHDFPEAVATLSPDQRRAKSDLRRAKVMDPNRELARQVIQSMEDIYSFMPGDMQALVDWAIQADPLQAVGVIASIERKTLELEETSQEYLNRTLTKLHTRLLALFNKFVDDQIRAIEETKVKINKRKGVIAFIRTFPAFSIALETMLTSAHDLEIRNTVNSAYIKINKTMFESLKVIARENPAAQAGSTDPEDKEALNYQILLIENMNHYLEEVDTRSNPVLEEWKYNANQEMDEHLSLYLGAVIRRPLGKLLDFIESTESLMLSRQPGDSFSKIAVMPSHSKLTFKKVLANYESKEIRKGIESLKRRVEKHFGDADDLVLSRGLVVKVLGACEKYYEKVEERILTISRDVYDGEVVAEWQRADVAQAFKSR